MLVRNLAVARVLAPDGHRYAVKVVRLLWRGTGSPVANGANTVVDGASNFMPFGRAIELGAGAASLLNNRAVWCVRVAGEGTWFGFRAFGYGEEWRDAGTAVHRAHEIAEGLAVGQKPDHCCGRKPTPPQFRASGALTAADIRSGLQVA